MQVHHLKQNGGATGAFVIHEEGEQVAELTYRRESNGDLAATHTFVEPRLRHRGVARQLVAAVVEEARRRGVQIVPVCPYVQRVLEDDAAWHDVLSTS